MKRLMLAMLMLALLLLPSCTAAVNPLAKAEATPVPGLLMTVHSATASDELATQMDMTLFFRYQQTDMLACETRTISVAKDESAELATVRQLLSGPRASHAGMSRLFPHNTAVTDVTASGDTLFITLSEGLLNDGIPANWQEDPLWRSEAPLRRTLTIQSLVATITENFPYPYVQVLIAHDKAANVSTRLDLSYFLDGRSGLEERLSRDESHLLTMQNTALMLLEAWQSRDYERLYLFTAASLPDDARPLYQDFLTSLDPSAALIDYAASGGHASADNRQATVALNMTYLADGQEVHMPAYPLRLVREDDVWKIPYSQLQRLMLR